MRICARCKQPKQLTDFYQRKVKGKTYPGSYCKPCTLEDQRERRQAGYKAPNRLTPEENTRKAWLRRLRILGITEDQYLAMLEAQGGRCAICRDDVPWSRSGTWHVDHCHDSGKVRGLLCTRCNRGLGYFRDDPRLLLEAIGYLAA